MCLHFLRKNYACLDYMYKLFSLHSLSLSLFVYACVWKGKPMPPPSPFERKQMLMQDLPLVASPTSLETHIYIYIY